MELIITGTNLEISADTQAYIEKKLSKLSKHLPDIIEIKVEVSEEGTRSPQERIIIRATVSGGASDAVFHGEERGKEIKIAVDKVADVMIRQLESYKGKVYNKGRGNPMARGKFPDTEELPELDGKLVKTKSFVIKAVSADTAIREMERLGHSFYLFLDIETGEIQLVYRRNDGNYGLIKPEIPA